MIYSQLNYDSDIFLDYISQTERLSYKIPENASFAGIIESVMNMLVNPHNFENTNIGAIKFLCAYKMLPIFEKNPELWNDIMLIGAIQKTNECFSDFLLQWKEVSQNKIAVQDIIDLFIV